MGDKTGHPTPLVLAQAVAMVVCGIVEDAPGVVDVLVAGSVRREKPIVSDLDLVVVTDEGHRDLTYLKEHIPQIHWTPKGGTIDYEGVWVELYLAPFGCAGATLQFLTGPGDLNVALRAAAKRRGWKLSQYGVLDRDQRRVDDPTGDPVEDDLRIFDALGWRRMSPQERSEWRKRK